MKTIKITKTRKTPKTLKTATSICLLSLALSIPAFAGENDKAKETEKQEAKAETTTTESGTLKNQTHCPVMGGEIDSTVFTDIQGQRVYHCCPMCSKKLVADPDKYFQKAAADSVLFENIQSKCPVSNEDLDPEIFTDFEGRRVFFCCKKCKSTFSKNPAKYLVKLVGQTEDSSEKVEKVEKAEETKAKSSGHEGHNH